jgi:hypothetical protein
MNKVFPKDFRPTKEFLLPICKVTLECYPSILVGDLKTNSDDTMEANLEALVKVIKSWNFYEAETDEKPVPITVENVKRLPATDFEWFSRELKQFSDDQKKSSAP